MSEVTLTSETRQSLLSLQRTAQVRATAADRLSTGLAVSRPTDAPVAYFQSQALSSRVADLLGAKDEIGQGLSAVETALDGLDALSSLTDQLRGIAQSAKGGTAEQRQAAASQFETLRQQFDALAADASYGGTALLTSPAERLSIGVNERGSTIDVSGTSADAASLGLGDASSTYNDFASDADIDAALSQLDSIRGQLRASSASYGGSVASLSIRESFNQNLTNTLEAGAQKLVQADLNEESATLLAADLRDRLGLAGLKIVQQNASLIADLL